MSVVYCPEFSPIASATRGNEDAHGCDGHHSPSLKQTNAIDDDGGNDDDGDAMAQLWIVARR